MESSLFDSFNARFLAPAQVAQRFVVPSHFEQVCGRNHAVIVGPRGSGKTTLLKMLQVSALKTWEQRQRSTVISKIDFTGVYIAADNSWTSIFADSEDFKISAESRDILALAVFLVYLQLAFVDTLEELSNEDLLDDRLLHRFYLPRQLETPISSALAENWLLGGATPTYFILRAKLGQRLNHIASLADDIKFGRFQNPSEFVESQPFLSLRYEFILRNSVDLINHIAQQPQRKWCICFDELEIVPDGLRDLLYQSFRSTDQRLLFKMSLSPFTKDLFARAKPNSPMPGQDYTLVSLSYHRTSDAARFGRELISSLLEEAGIDETPETIFGRSDPASTDTLSRTPISAYQAPQGERYRLIDSLRSRDPSFRDYLRNRGYDVANMPSMRETKRAELRKLLQIIRARIEFRQFGKPSNEEKRRGSRRSRKRIHLMYTGLESLLAICEGNPRWIIGILRPQILQYKRNTSHGNKSSLDRAYQARQIREVIDRYRALLGTIALKGSRRHSRASVLQLIEQIGNYMFRDVVLGPFKPEPVLSFIVDRDVSPAQVEALGTAVNQGAFIMVPGRTSHVVGDIMNCRFRMCYLLAGEFQLPLTYGSPVHLTTILRNAGATQQIALEYDET